LFRGREVGKGSLFTQPFDELRRSFKNHAQGTFHCHLKKTKLTVLKNTGYHAGFNDVGDRYFGSFAVLIITVKTGQIANLIFSNFVALVIETFLHTPAKVRAINQLHLAAPLRSLAVGNQPDIGEDAGVVEELIGQRDDGIEPVVLDNPAANIRWTGTSITRKQRRTVKDNGDFGANGILIPFFVGVHLGDHVLQKQQGAIVDGGQTGSEKQIHSNPKRTSS